MSLLFAAGLEFSRLVEFVQEYRVLVGALALAAGVAVVSARLRARSEDGYEVPTEEELIKMAEEHEQ
ncbi:hypothetical protein [Halarchaeum sp. P4]|uniref:hypothetical protein n=1 Tax=Halarchaeum sp. P4 TaxID=3421639 RepID=UPI003EC09EC8